MDQYSREFIAEKARLHRSSKHRLETSSKLLNSSMES